MAPRTSAMAPRNPNHGVSGYSTTGKAGDFQFQFHEPSVIGVRDTASSRYGVQAHGSVQQTEPDQFKPEFSNPAKNRQEIPAPNMGAFYMEPANSAEAENAYIVASRELSRVLQRKMTANHGTYLKDRMYEGFGQYDPGLQRMLRDDNVSQDIDVSETPSKNRHVPPSITPSIRQNEFQMPLQNTMGQSVVVPAPYTNNERPQLDQITRPTSTSGAVVPPGTAESAGGASSMSGLPNKPGSLPYSNAPYASLYPSPQPDIQPTGYSATPRSVVPQTQYMAKNHRPIQNEL